MLLLCTRKASDEAVSDAEGLRDAGAVYMAMSVWQGSGKAAGDVGARTGTKRGWSSMDEGERLCRHEDEGVGVDGHCIHIVTCRGEERGCR